MRRSRWLRYVLLAVLFGISVSLIVNFIFPAILNSRLLFAALVTLLLAGGLVMVAISAREMFRR